MSPSTAQEVREAIEAANEVFMATARKGDAAGLAALYTEEAQLLPPNADFQTDLTGAPSPLANVLGPSIPGTGPGR